MDELIRKATVGYMRLFPELVSRFHQNGDESIVTLIADKVIEKSEEKVLDKNRIKQRVKDLLKLEQEMV